ncbi:hypothetical protein L2E82_39873 [Cichorium intybus]|uniref:Uncharacterized protein n=1 Tax=Cichorium intybus TaxID=13427 RepID=A0ACB9AIR0_CICIN|nr:hypothetical protein L2E82_39873 [Cichorium intybus]
MKSEEAMLKLQSITKLEPLSGVVGFEPVVTQRRRRSPVCVVEPLTGGWSLEVDRWLEPWRLTGGWRLNDDGGCGRRRFNEEEREERMWRKKGAAIHRETQVGLSSTFVSMHKRN